MNLLIIGKNGQIGLSLIAESEANQIDYSAVGRAELDITQHSAVNAFFAQHHRFDFVINAAAFTNVDAAEKEIDSARAANALAVRYLAEACKQYDIPLIHISTDYIFDGEKNTGYNEEDTPNPKNVYGQTKLEGENHLKAIWKKHIILRVSWVFSEFGKNFVKTIVNLTDKKDVFSVVGDQLGSPTSAHSVANVIIIICKYLFENGEQENYWGVYHYADFPVTNWHQFATHIVRTKKTKKNTTVLCIESKEYPTAAQRPKNSILNLQKIKTVFDIDQRLWTSEVEKIIHKI
ncbi:MAG: dTDP-4-dehydrorhamnose reductase [Gammaproteobacteria bacterium RIFCSPHIGHO2_12_FULL_40_19]|nr:MAG: dTDP-4-dehydrorhamnose reductase [Gammaproteobacteria bacterium RIFCSPHIGHO2_12_FULL_40_19]